MKENILVTGGAGFIGSHLVDALLAAGHNVRVLDALEPQVHGGLRDRGEKPDYLNAEAEFIQGDIRDPEAVRKALEGVDVLFHEAALVGVGQSMYQIARYTDVNAGGTAVLLQVIINSKERPRKMIVASSMSIYGEGAEPVPNPRAGISKAARASPAAAAGLGDALPDSGSCPERCPPPPPTRTSPSTRPRSMRSISGTTRSCSWRSAGLMASRLSHCAISTSTGGARR